MSKQALLLPVTMATGVQEATESSKDVIIRHGVSTLMFMCRNSVVMNVRRKKLQVELHPSTEFL